jgi:hypothetical protein
VKAQRFHLVEADRGRSGLLPAIHAYESAMLEYGFDAVRRSLEVSNAVTSTNVLGRMAFRGVLRAADRLPWLHQRLFERPVVDLPPAPSTQATSAHRAVPTECSTQPSTPGHP